MLDHFRGAKVELKGLAAERDLLLGRAKMAQEAKIIDELGDIAVEKIRSDPSLADALIDTHFRGVIREQTNLGASLEKAEEQIKYLPPPADEDTPNSEDISIDEDFLNFWGHYAKNASSERMRIFLGRILAGEVQKPGSFSFTTLRVASELDAATAEIFKREVNRRFGRALIRPTDSELDGFVTLEAAGLIQGVGANLSHAYQLMTPGKVSFDLGDVRLMMELVELQANIFKIPVFPLTKVGMELAAILPHDDALGLRELAKGCSDKCTSMTLAARLPNGALTLIEKLK